jgi:putative methyltransferase (TIGR04325 family)
MTKAHVRSAIRGVVPPFLWEAVRRIYRTARPERPDNGVAENSIWFSAPHASWDLALASADGYAMKTILAQVRESTGKVRDGIAAAERDGVAFERPQWNLPLMACLSRIGLAANGALRVLDVGGSLGGTYFQFRNFVGRKVPIEWSIVEQPAFVEVGKRDFQAESLHFYPNISACLSSRTVDAVLLSGVLPYVPKPDDLLDEVLQSGVGTVIIDRTPVIAGDADLVSVQHVPPRIYGERVTYPAWFFSRKKLEARIGASYAKLLEFDSADEPHIIGGELAKYVGQLWELR